MEQRVFDLVLFGASSTTGRLTAGYLATHAPPGLHVALAGRKATELEAIRRMLGPSAQRWACLLADSRDAASLGRLARQARVVATTVGPYVKLGLPLVEACARHGTDYTDITGELPFMRESIDRYDAEAKRTGARIVHGCGFDSVPSDLGVFLLHEHLRRSGRSGRLKRATFVLESSSTGFSPGTLATSLEIAEQQTRDSGLRRLLADPYALSPERAREPDLGDERELSRPVFDAWLGHWTAPWMMAPINTRIVRRTNALLGYAYGRTFRYREVGGVPQGPRGLMQATMLTGMVWLMRSLRWDFMRGLLAKRLAKPSTGAKQDLLQGYFRVRMVAESEEGQRLSALITGQGSPGLGGTAVLFGEAALCLALDTARLPERSGVLTPATGLGLPLVERLRNAGMTFEVSLPAGARAPELPGIGEPGVGVATSPTSSAPPPPP